MSTGHHIDVGTADRLLAGRVDPDDAPPGYARLASILQAAAAPATEGPADPASMAALAAAVRANPRPPTTAPRRNPVPTKLLSARVALAAGALVLGSTAAAAATGNLPHSS